MSNEETLISTLASDAAPADKALACKHLAIYGTAKAVPELAKLLPNEQLSSWTRIALEAIPGPEAGEALTKATSSLEGRLLVGTINSIGVRRHADSVETLTALLQNQDEDVASASAVALGRIGNDAAVKSLKQALASTSGNVQSAVAEGCVLSAEKQLAAGKDAEAIALYDEVRKADVPIQRVLEATRGAILARKDKGIPLLLEQFRSPQKPLFQIALSTAREFPGKAVDKALATEMASAPPENVGIDHRSDGRPAHNGRTSCRTQGGQKRKTARSSRRHRGIGTRGKYFVSFVIARVCAGKRPGIGSDREESTCRTARRSHRQGHCRTSCQNLTARSIRY